MVFRESAVRGEQCRAEVMPVSLNYTAERGVADYSVLENKLRQKFLLRAKELRMVSSNFIPELFEQRQLQRGAPDCNCMAGLLQANESGVRSLSNKLDELKTAGLSEERAALYQTRIDRETKMLERGRAFFEAWCGASSNSIATPLACAIPVAPANPKIAALSSSLTCFLCSVMPFMADVEDLLAA